MGSKKNVGTIKGNTYYTWRTRKHVMRKWNSFGISCSILEKLKQYNVQKIHIFFKDGEHEILYISPLSLFLESPLEHNNNGDIQKHVPISMMRKIFLK